MSAAVQQILVAVAVAGAALFLVLRACSKKGGNGACSCAKKNPLK